MDLPAKSHDLNPIENAWVVLTRAVYLNLRQHETVGNLEASIAQKWLELDGQYLCYLVRGMQSRFMDVIEAQRCKTNH